MYPVLSATAVVEFTRCPRRFAYTLGYRKYTEKRTGQENIVQSILNRQMATRPLIDPIKSGARFKLDSIPLSASSLMSFKSCRRRFYYSKSGVEEKDKVDTTPFSTGSAVHNFFDTFFKAWTESGRRVSLLTFIKEALMGKWDKEITQFIFKSNREANVKNIGQIKEKVIYGLMSYGKVVSDIVNQGIEPQIETWFGRGTKAALPVIFQNQEYRFTGAVDLHYVKDGEVFIEDIKTGSSDYYSDDLQLMFYALSLEHWYKQKGIEVTAKTATFNYVLIDKRKIVDVSPGHREALDNALVALSVAIDENNFPKTTFPRECQNCMFRTFCGKDEGEVAVNEIINSL